MRRVLVVAMVAIAAVALYVTTAPAGEQAVTPKQFAALQKRVAKLEKTNKDVIDVLAFVYTCGFNKGAVGTTKAPQYHVPGTGEVADFYVLTTTDQDCVNAINSPTARNFLRKLGR